MVKANRIQDKVKGVGFDWEHDHQVWDKVKEEITELEQEVNSGAEHAKIEGEFGDVLFSLINYARHIKVNPEDALERTNKKFIKRFNYLEKRSAELGKPLDQISTAELVTGEILEANKYRMELIAAKPPSTRLSTQVWYYNKEMDNPQLVEALEEVGFTVTNMVAIRRQENDPTNAVWHGPRTPLEDYKTVIVTLIRAGIDIRRTGPSCKSLDKKIGVIEVGASDKAAGLINGIKAPTKSISQIRSALTYADLDDFACN